MQISKMMLERYLYEEVEGVFKRVVDVYSLGCAREDIDAVYNNLKNLTEEINEAVVEREVISYLSNSVLWIEGNDSSRRWSKMDLCDILGYIERNRDIVNNAIMEDLVSIINVIGEMANNI